MSLPWYKWYASDWIRCETRFELSAAERGIFRDLLDLHYLEGSIPENPGVLAGFLSVSKSEFDEAWPAVSKQFKADPKRPGRLVNQRAAEQIAEHDRLRQVAVNNGRRGGRPKSTSRSNPGKTQRVNSGLAKRKLSESESESEDKKGVESPLDSHPLPEPEAGKDYRPDEGLARFEALCRQFMPQRTPARPILVPAWAEIVTSQAIEDKVLAGFDAWKLSQEWRNGIVPRFDRWLLELRFENPPPPAKHAANSVDPTAYSNASKAGPEWGYGRGGASKPQKPSAGEGAGAVETEAGERRTLHENAGNGHVSGGAERGR